MYKGGLSALSSKALISWESLPGLSSSSENLFFNGIFCWRMFPHTKWFGLREFVSTGLTEGLVESSCSKLYSKCWSWRIMKIWTSDLYRVTFFLSAVGDRSGRALMLLRNINPTSDHFCEDCDRPLTSSPQQSEACQCHPWSPQPVIESIDKWWSLQDKRERELFQDHTREEGIFRKFVVHGISWNVFSRRYLFNVVRESVKFLFKN